MSKAMQAAIYSKGKWAGNLARPSNWHPGLWWVLAASGGGVIGSAAARGLNHLIVVSTTYDQRSDVTSPAMYLSLAGILITPALVWVGVGVGQWYVLGHYVGASLLWVLLTLMGFA